MNAVIVGGLMVKAVRGVLKAIIIMAFFNGGN